MMVAQLPIVERLASNPIHLQFSDAERRRNRLQRGQNVLLRKGTKWAAGDGRAAVELGNERLAFFNRQLADGYCDNRRWAGRPQRAFASQSRGTYGRYGGIAFNFDLGSRLF